jgi:hypothetical protein
MLALNWKFLTPLAFVVLMMTAILNTLLRGVSGPVYVACMLLANLALGAVVVEIVRDFTKRQRTRMDRAATAAAAGQ